MEVIGDCDEKNIGAVGSRENGRMEDRDSSHNDVVSRVVRENTVMSLWLEGHEVLREFLLFLGG